MAAARSMSKQKRRAVFSAIPAARKIQPARTETPSIDEPALRGPAPCGCWSGCPAQWPLRVDGLSGGLPPRCLTLGRMIACPVAKSDGTNLHHVWLPLSGSDDPPHTLDVPFLCPAPAGEDMATFAQHDYCPECRRYIARRTFDSCPASPVRWIRCAKHARHM